MTDLSRVIDDLVRVFESAGIPYALMGGLAVRVYGIPRPTYDVDFTIAIARERLPELYSGVEAAGYSVPDAYRNGWVDEVAGMPVVKFRLYLAERGVDADLFLAETPFQHELLRRRRRESINGITAWLISAEDLILLKLIAGRPRDIGDIGDIRFVQGHLDEQYLQDWAAKLGVTDALETLLGNPPL